MNKLASLFLTLVVLTVIGLALGSIPMIIGIVQCADIYRGDMNTLQYSVTMKDIDEATLCQRRHDNISNLETCIGNTQFPINISPEFVDQVRSVVLPVVQMVRSDINNISQMKNNHDQECVNYVETMFNKPFN
jgi:hypothetical protein